jgi:hypothetical protein
MKTNSIILVIILGFLMLGMMVTNPSLDDHRKEVAELLKKTISNGGNPTSGDIKLQKKEVIDLLIGTRIINTSINRTNLILFSLTTMQVGPNNNTIGFGVFGSVILFNQTGYQLAWQIQQQSDATQYDKEEITKTPKKKYDTEVEDPAVTYPEEQNTTYYSPGYYTPNASDLNRVYFHNRPDYSSRRNAYLVTQDVVYVEQVQNGFGYVRFTNDRGQVTTGWLDMSELIPN